MTDTTVTAAAPAVATNSVFATISSDFQWLEADVISMIQNIGAGIEVAAADIASGLGWLGSHIGQIATTVSAVQSSVIALNAAGIPIPAALTAGIADMNNAVAGVNAALTNQAIDASSGKALTEGYQATKALQIAAAGAAGLSAAIQAATAPVLSPVPTGAQS